MVALWQRLTDFWPQWESLYGTVDDAAIYAWTIELSKYEEADLAGALKQCTNWDGKFPPSFPEFKALVMAARSANKPTITEQRIALEKKGATTDDFVNHLDKPGLSTVAKRELANIKKNMAGEEVMTKEQAMHNLKLNALWS